MLIRQSCRGNYRSNDFDASAGDLAPIVAIMEGVIEQYEKKAEGGTDVPTPSVLRGLKFGVSRPADNLSGTVNIKHLKVGKDSRDVFAAIGLFDADYKSALKATKIRQIYQGAKV